MCLVFARLSNNASAVWKIYNHWANKRPRGLHLSAPVTSPPWNPSNITAIWYREVEGGPSIESPLCREARALRTTNEQNSSPNERWRNSTHELMHSENVISVSFHTQRNIILSTIFCWLWTKRNLVWFISRRKLSVWSYSLKIKLKGNNIFFVFIEVNGRARSACTKWHRLASLGTKGDQSMVPLSPTIL